jgi:hypothetical protein
MSQTPSSVPAETPNSDRRALAVLFAIVFCSGRFSDLASTAWNGSPSEFAKVAAKSGTREG